MEPIIPAQTNNVTPIPKHHHRVMLIIFAVVSGVLYITGNIWFYFYVTGRVFFPAAITGFMRKTGALLPTDDAGTSFTSEVKMLPTPTTTPRPTGPGTYACDPVGQCKIYSDDVRKEKCTVTYADLHCLDRCGDATKRCKP